MIMPKHTSLLTFALFLAPLLLLQDATSHPDINNLKKGVVRVKNTKLGDVGTGVIVRVDAEQAYIVTAAHVVQSDQNPEVYFFNQQDDPLRAQLIDREDDNQKGLALLRVKAKRSVMAGLTALNLGSSFELHGGEEVRFIGFPEGTSIWTVASGNVARQEGRAIVFSGPITKGNSGGPMLLRDRMIGLVTDLGPSLGYAVQAESVALYVRGIKRELADTITTAIKNPPPPDQGASTDEFCESLATLVTESKTDFRTIKGKLSVNHYHSTLQMPGASNGYILDTGEAYYYVLIDKNKSKVEAEYDKAVSKLIRCLSGWQHNEVRKDYRRYKFRESDKGTVVSLQYNLDLFKANENYYLTLRVFPPGNNEW